MNVFTFANPGYATQSRNSYWLAIRAAIELAGVELSSTLLTAGERYVRDLCGEPNPAYATLPIWGNLQALYGVLGGTAETHAINWISPGGRFGLSYANTTHDSNGMQFGPGGYASTGLNARNDIDPNSGHLACYVRGLGTGSGVDMGAAKDGQYFDLIANYQGVAYFEDPYGGMIAMGITDARGWTCGSRTSSTAAALYRNAGPPALSGQSAGQRPDAAIALGGRGTGGGYDSNQNMSMASVGRGLSTAQNNAFYTATQAFMTARGISV
jgi:hypothetical protein